MSGSVAAQPLTSSILTPDGWVSMGEAVAGQVICGAHGETQQICSTSEAGSHETYTLTFSDGTDVQASASHKWAIDQVLGKRQRKEMSTAELAENYSYQSPKGQIFYRYRVPQQKPVHFRDSGSLPLHPYLVGALLGDGSVSGVPNASPSITSVDEEVLDAFRRLLPDGCILTHNHRCSWRIVDSKGRQGNKHKSRARQAVVDSGIAGSKAADKSIPEKYLMASMEDRLHLLRGLMDTDGSASSSMTTYHTGSEQLAKDVQFLVQSLGGVATMRKTVDNRKASYLDMNILNIYLPDGVIPFTLARKIDMMKPRKNRVARTIVSIEKDTAKTDTRSISVSNDDGLYITDGMIVTRDCA